MLADPRASVDVFDMTESHASAIAKTLESSSPLHSQYTNYTILASTQNYARNILSFTCGWFS